MNLEKNWYAGDFEGDKSIWLGFIFTKFTIINTEQGQQSVIQVLDVIK